MSNRRTATSLGLTKADLCLLLEAMSAFCFGLKVSLVSDFYIETPILRPQLCSSSGKIMKIRQSSEQINSGWGGHILNSVSIRQVGRAMPNPLSSLIRSNTRVQDAKVTSSTEYRSSCKVIRRSQLKPNFLDIVEPSC